MNRIAALKHRASDSPVGAFVAVLALYSGLGFATLYVMFESATPTPEIILCAWVPIVGAGVTVWLLDESVRDWPGQLDDVRESLSATVRSALRSPQDGQLRCSCRILIAVVSTFGAAFGFILTANAVGIDPPDWAEIAVVHPTAVIGVLIAMSLLKRYVDHRDVTDYGFNLSRQWGIDALAGLASGVFLMTGLFVIEYQQGGVRIIGTWTDASAVPIVLQVGILLFGWIALSVWEETLFRGVFITNAVEGLASRGFSDRAVILGALLSSSVVFGFGHGISGGISTGDSLLYALVMTSLSGVLHGWAYLLSGELAFPIGLHTGINLTTTTLISSSGATYPKVIEYSVSGGSIGFQTSDPISLLSVYAVGILFISGYFYSRYGTVVPESKPQRIG